MKIYNLRKIRHKRLRRKVIGTELKPRLAVFRSNKHLYAQIINDQIGRTLAAASTLSKEFSSLSKNISLTPETPGESSQDPNNKKKKSSIQDSSYLLGKLIANKAKELGIKQVCFDRGGYKYHGKVKRLSEGAREGGLIF